jgi:hypothetical protein
MWPSGHHEGVMGAHSHMGDGWQHENDTYGMACPFELGVHPLVPYPHPGFDATLLWHSLETRLTSMFDQSVLP